MKTPTKYLDSAKSALVLECSYPKFMRLHAKEIPSIQLYQNGPRLFLETDVLKYKEEKAA